MARPQALTRILEPIEEDIMGAYLFGSHARGTATPQSDIDVCLVAGPEREARDVLATAWRKTRLRQEGYDVRIFEELPMYLKAQVLEEGELVFTRDEPAMSEYLRRWRKLWADQAHRNRTTEADIERIMAARRKG